MVNRATEKDGKVMETPTPTPGLCHGRGPASPPWCPHLSELPEEGQGGDQAVFWGRQRKGGLCLPWSTQGVMDDATLVPSSATLPLRNRRDGHSGNSVLLLHTPLEPLSFLNFLLLLFFLFFPSSFSRSFLFFLSFFGGTGRKGLTQRRNSADKSISSSEEQPSQQAPQSSREMSLPWGNLCMEG